MRRQGKGQVTVVALLMPRLVSGQRWACPLEMGAPEWELGVVRMLLRGRALVQA